MTPDILMEAVSRYAETTLVDTKNRLYPTWFVPLPDELRCIVTPWGSDFERKVMQAGMRALLRDSGAVAYAIISEMWVVTHEGTTWPKDAGAPRLDPKRREGVAAFVVARSGERQVRLWDIKRDYKGTIRLLTPAERPNPKELGGALVNMFGKAES